MTEPNPKLDTIRKLLAKAEDQACTPEEAELFNAKARALIAKYGIDEALLAAANPNADRVADRVIDVDAPYARDKAQLLAEIALSLRCKVIRNTSRRDGRTEIRQHLYGFGADLDRVELLYTSLLVQASYGAVRERVPWGEDPAAYRRSWYAGFTMAVGRRIRAAEAYAQRQAEAARSATRPAAASDGGPSVALVLADRSALVNAAVAAAHPDAKKAQPRRLSGSGLDDGHAAGRRADLGGTRIPEARTGRALPSPNR